MRIRSAACLAVLILVAGGATAQIDNFCTVYEDETIACNDPPNTGCSSRASLPHVIVGGGTAFGCNHPVTQTLTCPNSSSCQQSSAQFVWTSNPYCEQTYTACGCVGDGCVGGGGGCQDTDGTYSPSCVIECCCDPDGEGCTPIIVDTTGDGFHLTSGSNGVTYDFLGNGNPFKLSWTAAGSGNAFLACLDCWKDLPNTGKIDSGKKLFGNLTEQPLSAHPNGYLALAEFDKPENGGNGDGIIDNRDAVYPKLLLWIDENHDGISQPNELHTLPELGVFSISLKYNVEPFVDQYGNRFRYRGVLNPDPLDGKSKDGRYTYDVFFVPGKAAYGTAQHLAALPRFAWGRLAGPDFTELMPRAAPAKPNENGNPGQNNQ
ncbi:MAG TPA: hypothetical protein VGG14_01680 [Candidatus Sulfotelmatobacter sp.]|jgi:hypothetical protein